MPAEKPSTALCVVAMSTHAAIAIPAHAAPTAASGPCRVAAYVVTSAEAPAKISPSKLDTQNNSGNRIARIKCGAITSAVGAKHNRATIHKTSTGREKCCSAASSESAANRSPEASPYCVVGSNGRAVVARNAKLFRAANDNTATNRSHVSMALTDTQTRPARPSRRARYRVVRLEPPQRGKVDCRLRKRRRVGASRRASKDPTRSARIAGLRFRRANWGPSRGRSGRCFRAQAQRASENPSGSGSPGTSSSTSNGGNCPIMSIESRSPNSGACIIVVRRAYI